MHSNHPEITGPAMSVIKNADYGTWEQINADDTWNVYVLVNVDQSATDTVMAVAGYNPIAAIQIIQELDDGAAGLTPGDIPRNQRWTIFNMPLIRETAEHQDLPVSHLLASTLVHEFRHHNGADTEWPAYTAEIAFDRKMGDPAWTADRIEMRQEQG